MGLPITVPYAEDINHSTSQGSDAAFAIYSDELSSGQYYGGGTDYTYAYAIIGSTDYCAAVALMLIPND